MSSCLRGLKISSWHRHRKLSSMTPDVAQLLESLRTEGTIDSEGAFTISLSQARAKMSSFRSSSKSRYLLFLLSAGVGSGATRANITDIGGRLVIHMPKAYIAEEALLQVLETGVQAQLAAASDMAFGLRDALDSGAESALLEVTHPTQRSYSWFMTSNSEESQELAHRSKGGMKLTLDFGHPLFARLMSLLRRPPERSATKLLKKAARHCQVPIYHNLRLANQSFELPDWPCLVQIGQPSRVAFPRSPLVPDVPHTWTAGLAFLPGKVSLVVRGVNSGVMQSSEFSGIVFHDKLHLDLSREKIVQDETFRDFIVQLDSLKSLCLETVASTLPDFADEVPWFLSTLVMACVKDEVSHATQSLTYRWLRSQVPQNSASSRNSWDTGTDLLNLGLAFEQQNKSSFRIDGEELYVSCLDILWEKKLDKTQVLQRAADFTAQRRPTELLLRGYLLLGLGALFTFSAEKDRAEQTWSQALMVGRGSVVEELFAAHLGHPPEHVATEAAKALQMLLR
jgi:hypothetical protein